MVASAGEEKLLVSIYTQGVDMRTKFGGSATAAPKFPDKATSDEYASLTCRGKRFSCLKG